jgi:hypothetical protein
MEKYQEDFCYCFYNEVDAETIKIVADQKAGQYVRLLFSANPLNRLSCKRSSAISVQT